MIYSYSLVAASVLVQSILTEQNIVVYLQLLAPTGPRSTRQYKPSFTDRCNLKFHMNKRKVNHTGKRRFSFEF